MSVYGTASVVTMVSLGHQTFFTIDEARGQLRSVDLKLSGRVEGVEPFDDSILLDVLTLLPDSPLLNLGGTLESST